VRLGETEPAARVARGEARQETAALVVGTVMQHDERGHGVAVDDPGQRHPAATDLLDHPRVDAHAQAESAVLRGHERAEEAELAHPRHQCVGILIGVLEGQGDRDHLGIDEPANDREQGMWNVAQAGASWVADDRVGPSLPDALLSWQGHAPGRACPPASARRRRVRLLGAASAIPPPRPRRFLIIQIDGLSRAVLEHALATGQTPTLARLLGSGWLAKRAMSVGLPSSTPAFQMAVMYGVYPDIPGFHYYDKRAGEDRYFPRPGVAALVEEQHARGRRGIMRGGATYGCIFAGEATDYLWTLAGLLKPTRSGWAILRAPLSAVLLAWVIVKCTALTLLEIARALGRFITRTAPPGRARAGCSSRSARPSGGASS
jgi:hypothetical protein